MAELNQVVAHFANGSLLKGKTQDFYPNRPVFHVLPVDGAPPVEVECSKLKAIFFVKDLAGRDKHRLHDSKGFLTSKNENSQGKKLAVRFRDGELLCGYSLAYVPGREGFFMFPSDAESNNLRVYVINAAAVEVKSGPEADALARKVLAEKSKVVRV